MTNELRVVLMDLLELCDQNSNAIEQVVMLDVEGLSQLEKDKRLKVLDSIALIHDGCKKTLARIEAL